MGDATVVHQCYRILANREEENGGAGPKMEPVAPHMLHTCCSPPNQRKLLISGTTQIYLKGIMFSWRKGETEVSKVTYGMI